MPPDAFMFETSGQLVMQTAIGGAGTLFGPLVGAAVWLYLQRLPADHAASRRDLEAGARRRVRAAGLLPAPRAHRRHRRSLSACERRAYKTGPVEDAPTADVTAEDQQNAAAATPRVSRRLPPCRHAAASRPHQRPDPAGQGADQALRRPGRQQRHRFHRQPRRAARHHRPERRRQDHLLQDADLRSAADVRPDPVRGPRHHRHDASPTCASSA